MPARILITFLSFFLDLVGKLSYLINIKTANALPITFNHIRNNLMSNQSEPLSRRDQLAAAVMQGIITANAGKRVGSYEMAETAVKHADALITALAKIQA